MRINMEVAPGIVLLRVPVPFPIRHINLYLIRGESGYTLVDCGPVDPESTAALTRTLTESGCSLGDIR